MSYLLRTATAAIALTLSACATYRAEPLPQAADAVDAPARVRIDPRTMPLPALAAHRFDPSDGFDMTETAMLAVANNPDLKLARDDLGIATAQAFNAGLLPDPQLNLAGAYPAPASPGLTKSFGLGATIDVLALLNRSNNKRSADATVAKTDLGLLWQEWQVVAQARQLFVRSVYQARLAPLQTELRDANRLRYANMAQASQQGNLTQDALTAALTAYQDAQTRYTDAARLREQTRHELNALLGLAPQVTLTLTGAPDCASVPDDAVRAALAAMPARRPDLLALQAGYASQEIKYRGAIIAQFPALTVGFVRARDTSDIYSNGLQFNVNLPVFNRNRGNIAVEKATRQRLRDEYQNRLNQAALDVDRLQADAGVLSAALADANAALPSLRAADANAQAAFATRDITLGVYTDARAAALLKEIDALNFESSLCEQRIALQALLGGPLPDAHARAASFTQSYAEPTNAK